MAAVQATARGEAVFTPGLAGLVLGEFRRMSTQPQADPSRPIPELTERETEVLKLVATGMSYKEIASDLFISHRTVQNHVQNTLGKLQLHNRIELVRFAIAGRRPRDPLTKGHRVGRLSTAQTGWSHCPQAGAGA